MLKSDKKLSQQVKVLVERLPSSEDLLPGKNVKSNELHKQANYNTSKKINKDVSNKESYMSSSIKKEKKVFDHEMDRIEVFSKVGNTKYYSEYVKSEKVVLDPYENLSSSIDLNQKVTPEPKETFVKEEQIEKDTKDSLKSIIESNILSNRNLRKRPGSSKNYPGIKKQNKVEPLIELVPLVVKTEVPEIRTVKKIQRKACNLVNLDKKKAENSIQPIPSELVSENAYTSFNIPHEAFKAIGDYSKTIFTCQREIIEEETPAVEGADESSHHIVKSPEHNIAEKDTNESIAESTRQTLQKPDNDFVEKDSLNQCTVESIHQTVIRTEIDLLDEAPNRAITECNHETLERLSQSSEDEFSNNDINVDYIHKTPEKSKDEFVRQSLEKTDFSPVDILQNLDVQHEPKSTADSTTRCDINSDKVIKVKPPQVLGIQNLDVPLNSQSTSVDKWLNVSQLRQISCTSGNEPRTAEICKVYPIFFTSEARHEISILIHILHKTSGRLTFEDIKNKRYNETYFLNIQNYSSIFVKTFNRVLKLDQIGLDKDLLKKIIPILYLQVDRAFKKLRPNEDFDFRIIMKKFFKAESFVCVHDVILEKNYEMFQKVMISFGRWLEDIFVECDLSDSLEPVAAVTIAEDGNPSLSGQFSPHSLEYNTMELENDNLSGSREQLDSSENVSTQDTAMSDSNVEPNYLQCPLCRKNVPLCFICKELLICPCKFEIHLTLAFDRGPESLTLCSEHSGCGDNWPQWLEDWNEEGEDHDMPFNPICWNGSCNKKAKLICVCRTQAYCSTACQAEHWYKEHHKSCSRESDPRCLFSPQDKDMDLY